MKYTLHIVRKPVKYIRLKVLDKDNVQAVAPKLMPKPFITRFVKKKQKRIQSQIEKFEHAHKQFKLWENQILLHGEPYTCITRLWQWLKYTVDHKQKFIRRWHDVLNASNTHHRYRTYAKNILPVRLKLLAEKHNISYNKCFIRDQKTKRGSCSWQWHIGLNRRLVMMPTRVSDYVILHELAHRTHMNHSIDFWNACKDLCPKTDEARIWLKQYGRILHMK